MFIFNYTEMTITCSHCGHQAAHKQQMYYVPAGHAIRMGCSACHSIEEGDLIRTTYDARITLYPEGYPGYLVNIEVVAN